jgi:hypothetical protein
VISIGLCFYCKHFNMPDASCKAFPDGIPSPVVGGQAPHFKPFNGVKFEPKQDLSESGKEELTELTEALEGLPDIADDLAGEEDGGIEKNDEDGSATNTVAGPERDAEIAERLLRATEEAGKKVLEDITRSATTRLLKNKYPLKQRKFYSQEELTKLAEALASALSPAELLGRTRTIKRWEAAKKTKDDPEKFSESEPTDWSSFDENDPGRKVQPMPPERALNYFRAIAPKLNDLTIKLFGEQIRRAAFKLAATTNQTALDRTHTAIRQRLETGQGISTAPGEIDEILASVGVTPRNPQYSEMLLRTNMMESYNQGAMDQMRDPEIMEDVPVWEYLGIKDGRQRPSHEVHFNKYYPNTIDFAEVRDHVDGTYSAFNCRCVANPITKWTWAKLQAKGASIANLNDARLNLRT